MSAVQPGPDRIRDYLLRRMSEEERAAFESAYFADDRLLDRVEEEEDGLVSDYVLGRLTETDRRRFEESLLGSPYYKERVETTSRLRQRLASHRAFDRRRKGTAPPRPLPARRASDDGRRSEGRLFPGRTGTIIAFAFLSLLLIASILSAVSLRKELVKARAAAVPPAAPPAERPSDPALGVVPSAQSVVLLPPEVSGPSLRRLARRSGAPLLLVIPSKVVPEGARSFAIAINTPDAAAEWHSGRLSLPPGSADIALRLPAGIPPDGSSSVVLQTQGTEPGRDVSLGVLEITTAR